MLKTSLKIFFNFSLKNLGFIFSIVEYFTFYTLIIWILVFLWILSPGYSVSCYHQVHSRISEIYQLWYPALVEWKKNPHWCYVYNFLWQWFIICNRTTNFWPMLLLKKNCPLELTCRKWMMSLADAPSFEWAVNTGILVY